jgi:superfamily II DNA or RNA helicase
MIESLESVIKPYDYQVPVIDAVEEALEIRDEALYVMGMGLGKTLVSAFVAKPRLLRGQKGLYLCHENYILKNVQKDYRKVVGDSITYKTFYGSESDGKKDWTADTADMLFASFQALNNWHDQWFLAFEPDHFDFIVIDESHHGPAPTYKEVIDYFIAKKIFMTATPVSV